MAAKLLHSLTDDNPDLQKQLGCMTGIFQLFDRQPVITHRRIIGHSPTRRPPGISHFNNDSFETESNTLDFRSAALEKYTNTKVQERREVSKESSRASFSSSRSSSFSSLDCSKTIQPEHSSFDRIIFPETPLRDPVMVQSGESPQFAWTTVDIRDVVRDSMYREIQGLSIKPITKEEGADHGVKHRDSQRSLQLSKSNDKSHSVGINEKQSLPVDLNESARVLAKLREAPWYFNEAKGLSRSSSYSSKDGSLFSVAKDAPRFSYDGREMNCLKLKELPRLSLDSREGSRRSFNTDSKSSSRLRRSNQDNSDEKVPSLLHLSGTQTRPANIVAKLMGLETLPDSATTGDRRMSSVKASPVEHSVPHSLSTKTTDPCRPIQTSNCSRNSWKEPTSPRWRNPDSVVKPISIFPIEPAPWRQFNGTRGPPKPVSGHLTAPAKATNSFPSVYSEIEKRLKDLEFTQSDKDLRALKKILEAMQVKGLLETRKGEQDSNFATQKDHEQRYARPFRNAGLANQRKPQSDRMIISTNRGPNSLRNFQSPIVIMKPAKLVEQSGIPASSVIPLDGLSSSSLPKLQNGDVAYNRKGSTNSKTATDRAAKTFRGDNVVNSTDMKTNNRYLKSAQTSTRPQQLPKESTTGSVNSSGVSICPRMQQKKLDLEKRSRSPTPPPDSVKSRRQSNKQQSESSSPGGRRRPKSSNFEQSDHLNEMTSEMRNLSYKDNNISLQSDGNSVLDVDTEVTSFERSAEINGSQSPSMKAVVYSLSDMIQENLTSTLSGDESLLDLATVSPEYPSPVSVLDIPVYTDDAVSPVEQTSMTLRDNGSWNSDDNSTKEQQKPADVLISNTTGPGITSEINCKKLQNIEHLVQKLRRLNSSHDEARADYIASLCENSNLDHRYISEILLASGLLLRDLSSSLTTFQFHPSGHPINPELFFVLEQTKAITLPKDERSNENEVQLNPDKEKFHRKLIFDAVNEILVRKLASIGPPEPWLRPRKLSRETLNAKNLLRELCVEIEHFQPKKSEARIEEEDDGLKSILWEDMVCRSERWTDFHGEISGAVLDVERLIFKDLVNEIVIGGAAGLRAKPGRRCRQLFAK